MRAVLHRVRLMLALSAVGLCGGGTSLSQAAPIQPSTDEALANASAALESGDAETAMRGYESAAQNGLVNGHLFYNLGIAYQKTGRTGEAMAAFLAARRYLPRDPDVAANLRFVLGTIKDKLEVDPPRGPMAPLTAILSKVTARELALATGVLLSLSGCLVLVALLVPSLAPFRRVAWWSPVVPLVAGVLLSAKITREEVWGATFSKTPVKVYSGPANTNTVLFELEEGAPVLVRERGNAGYLKVQLSDGKSGWIAGSQVRVLGEPFGAALASQ